MHLSFPISYHLPHPLPHISSLQLWNHRAKAILQYAVPFHSSGPLHVLFQTLTMLLHLCLLDTIHHSYLVHPNSHATSSVRHFLAPPGNCFSYNLLCIRELHLNSHCSTFHAGSYSLLIEQSLPSEWEMWAGNTQLGLNHLIIPSVKHILRTSTSSHMTIWWPSIWEVLWVIYLTWFRKEG